MQEGERDMNPREALKLALEALEAGAVWVAINTIKEALAQPEQEVDWEKLYRLEVKKKEALAAKYERDIKPLTKIVPMAQLKQEPMALEAVYETIIQWDEGGGKRSRRELARRIVALYTTPPQPEPVIDKSAAVRIATSLGWEPQRTWVGLTDEEREIASWTDGSFGAGARWAEDKLKEKNT
jgi:hypothetical protein